MSNLPYLTPFDILVKSFFHPEENFEPVRNRNIHHPVDIYENESGLTLEVACTGLSKEHVEVTIEGDMVRIKHDRAKKADPPESSVWYANGISRRSFNLGFKIASRFDVQKASAKFENGLLIITIPTVEEKKPKLLAIKG